MLNYTVNAVEKNLAIITATGFGVGYIPWASGTWGTLLAVAMALPWVYALPFEFHQQLTLSTLMLCVFLWGSHASQVAGVHLGKADHSAIVLDEMVAMWWVLILMPDMEGVWLKIIEWLPSLANSPLLGGQLFAVLLAFLLFRFFDITKPFPANWIDRNWHHGFGVMLDDIVAAIYSVIVLWLLKLI